MIKVQLVDITQLHITCIVNASGIAITAIKSGRKIIETTKWK